MAPANDRDTFPGILAARLNPDLQAKLAQLASQRGRDTEALVVEAVERLVNYDEWFIREVEKGIGAADRGKFIEHGEVIRTTLRDNAPVTTRNQP